MEASEAKRAPTARAGEGMGEGMGGHHEDPYNRSYKPEGGWTPLPRDRARRVKGEHTTLALLLAMVAVTHPLPQ